MADRTRAAHSAQRAPAPAPTASPTARPPAPHAATCPQGAVPRRLPPLPEPLEHVEIAALVALATAYRLPLLFHAGVASVRPVRHPSPDALRLLAALRARLDEVSAYLRATRPHPLDPERARDAAAWRVCRMPWELLATLALHDLTAWLAAVDEGRIAYAPTARHRLCDRCRACDVCGGPGAGADIRFLATDASPAPAAPAAPRAATRPRPRRRGDRVVG